MATKRRGIVLLVVLSVMILFLLIGITYVLNSTQFLKGANSTAQDQRYGDLPKDTAYRAMLELIRGSSNPNSPLQHINMLQNMYGDPVQAGAITSVTVDAATGLWVFNIALSDTASVTIDGLYNGCVFTITSGQGRGSSMRIVADLLYSQKKLYTFPPGGDSGLPSASPNSVILANDQYLINGRPFSSTGTGFDPAKGVRDATAGQNLDYTAADYNCWFLAYQPGIPGSQMIPSFHRPEVIQFMGGASDKNMLRPDQTKHTAFKVANPAFDPIKGPWDVDNDGDGFLDSVWTDWGFPVITARDGRQYKPLVAALVLDMDGRINVNVHGNTLNGNLTTSTGARGLGFGPAEIALNKVLPGEAATVITQRYGSDSVAGDANLPAGAQYQFPFLIPDSYGSSTFGSPIDVWGIGTVSLDAKGNPDWTGGFASSTGNITKSPYKVDMAVNAGRPSDASTQQWNGDKLFSPADLEGLLRMNDQDAALLPTRLSALVGATKTNNADRRFLVTTDSYHVPRVPADYITRLRNKLKAAGVSDVEAHVKLMAPRELIDGLPLDLNKVYNYNNTDDPIIGKLLTSDPYAIRQLHARHLYVLARVLMDGPNGNSQPQFSNQQLAQWAINAVQFMYNDSVMVPFEYADDPFTNEGWHGDGDISSASPDNTETHRRLVWGCTFPDLLLMENGSFHDCRKKDTANDTVIRDKNKNEPTKRDATKSDKVDPDPDLDQVRVPQGSTFVKLMCPRTDKDAAHLPSDLYTGGKLDLGKMAPAGANGAANPVWRIAVVPTIKDSLTLTGNGPAAGAKATTMTLIPETDGLTIERIIWFSATAPGAGHPDAGKIFYARSGSPQVSPGTYLNVGPRQKTAVGSDATGNDVNIYTLPANSLVCGADKPPAWGGSGAPYIGMNISEPLPSSGKYYDKPIQKWKFTTAETYDDAYGEETPGTNTFPDKPFDEGGAYPGPLNGDVSTGTRVNFRTFLLQRLANPAKAYDKDTNPYITVDWMPADLTVFNGSDQNPNPASTANPFDPSDQNPGTKFKIAFSTRQRGSAAAGDKAALYSASTDDPAAGKNGAGNFAYQFTNYLGSPNSTYDAGKPFPWFAWNARPYVSPLELMLVPMVGPSRLTTDFGLPTMLATASNVYQNNVNSYRHLLNFFQTQATGAPVAGNLYSLFDYVGIQSPFVGALRWSDKLTSIAGYHAPFNYVSNRRDPGRVNLNTISDRSVWEALLNGATGPTWEQFVVSRRGYGAPTDSNPLTIDTNSPSCFRGAFRNYLGGNSPVVPAMKRDGVDTGLLRQNAGQPFLYSASTAASTDTTRNAYFTYQQMARMANLTTTRSNVFACWLTVGYFEVMPASGGASANFPDGYQLGPELGSDTGEVTRHRLFFLFDRTIPVAYQRGIDHNVHKAILLMKYLE